MKVGRSGKPSLPLAWPAEEQSPQEGEMSRIANAVGLHPCIRPKKEVIEMTQQLEAWSGEFGKQYTDRNQVDWLTRVPFFRSMVEGLLLSRVLEVGCNRGHNLVALGAILGTEAELIGVEPGAYARQIALAAGIDVRDGDAFSLPFPDGHFDLVFTAGVLIHVALEDLPRAMREVYRCSRRYLLAVEYFSEEDTAIHYRGHQDLLWKRDFQRHYQTLFPGLTITRQGYFEQWDRANWWLLEKPAPGAPHS
jgi:pseudaminic acid biosynthesis-associated methylase